MQYGEEAFYSKTSTYVHAKMTWDIPRDIPGFATNAQIAQIFGKSKSKIKTTSNK